MELTFEAIFDGEVFRPTEEVNLKPNIKVRLTVVEIIPQTLELTDSLQINAPSDFSTKS
jgi:predicted DNA-binding antitoxin AbrB/MazE fold protein